MPDQKFTTRGGMFHVPADLPEVPPHPTESKERFYNGFIIRVLKAVMRAQGLKITVFGAENLPTTGGALLAMNHTGYYDFILGEIPGHVRGKRLVRFMAKKEIFEVPVIGTFMRNMDHVSVDRSAGASSREEAVDRLGKGQIVGIFPEATVSRSFEIKDLKTGAVRIAEQAGVPLVPMISWGGQRIWTKGHKKRMGRTNTPIHIRLGAPVDASGDPEVATERLREAMKELLEITRTEYEAEYGPFPGGEPWRPASMGGSAPTLEQAGQIDARVKAAQQEKKQAKADERAARTARKLNRKADSALGNGSGIITRLKNRFRK